MQEENNKKRDTGLRVVLDTNIYVSAFAYPRGEVSQLWHRARSRAYVLLLSPAIVNELGRVLRDDFGWNEEQISPQFKELSRMAEIVTPKVIPNVISHDETDNQILACALEGKAHLIVTGDRDLLRLKAYEGIGIMRPRDFLHTLEGY
jgi:putative PIN family toxin of toxin-antitoxin system